MDPEATWRNLLEAITTGDSAAMDHADDLREWIEKGGFWPKGLQEAHSNAR